MNSADDPVSEISRSVFGIEYLYPWQRLIIAAVTDSVCGDETSEKMRRIAVLPTGSGKSLCWMLPAVMISGLTVAVFPLLSLMADQQRRLSEVKVPSVTLKGGLSQKETQKVWADLETRKVKIVLTNPEMLNNPRTAERLAALKPQFFVVDETHTVTQWGESFRPACAGMGKVVELWDPQAVLALTATAGTEIRKRIRELLFNGEAPEESLADPDRPAIRYGVIPTLSRNHTLERLVREERRPMLVFSSTRRSAETAAGTLRERLRDNNIRFYHAGLTREEKSRLESWFLSSSDGILCATCAYGMGVDKPDIRTVIHLSPPSSAEAYLQESGRASRDGKGARAWMIHTPEDLKITAEPKSQSPSNNSESDILSRYQTNGRRLMTEYALSADRCRREVLLKALGTETEDCSGCDVCGGQVWKTAPEEEHLLYLLRKNPRRFAKGQAARILTGRRSAEIRRAGLDTVRGFGILKDWESEDAEDALDCLLNTGKLRTTRRGRLVVVRGKS